MTGITDKNSGGTTLVSYGYTYDAAGRVTQEVRNWDSGSSTDTLTYGYTNNNQLTSVSHTNASFTNESFTWDANGNQTARATRRARATSRRPRRATRTPTTPTAT